MDSEQQFDGNEFDYVVELIVAVFFMFIAAVGIATFVTTLYSRVNLEARVDKVQVKQADYYGENYPFYYTGYQAYMFAWMMDGSTDDPLTWLGHTDTVVFDTADPPANWTSDAGNGAFMRLEVTGTPSSFRVLRNRAIVGVEEFEKTNIRNTIKNMAARYHNLASQFDIENWETNDTHYRQCLYSFYNPNFRCSSHSANDFANARVKLSFTAGEDCADLHTVDKIHPDDFKSNHKTAAEIKHHVLKMSEDDVGTWRYEYEWLLHPCQ